MIGCLSCVWTSVHGSLAKAVAAILSIKSVLLIGRWSQSCWCQLMLSIPTSGSLRLVCGDGKIRIDGGLSKMSIGKVVGASMAMVPVRWSS